MKFAYNTRNSSGRPRDRYQEAAALLQARARKRWACAFAEQARLRRIADIFASLGSASVSRENLVSGMTVAVVKATLIIDERVTLMPPSLRGGLFAAPASFDAIVRFNVTERGASRMSIRLYIPDYMQLLPEHELNSDRKGFNMVDFLVAEGLKEFVVSSAEELEQLMTVGMKPTVMGALRNLPVIVKASVNIFAAKMAIRKDQGLFGKSYFAGLPVQCGAGAAKLAFIPLQDDPIGEECDPMRKLRSSLVLNGKEQEVAAMLTAALTKIPDGHTPTFDLVVQESSDPEHQSYKRGGFWCTPSEQDAPFLPVGKLQIHKEELLHADALAPFNPWNQVVDHRPIGALNRARFQAYRAHQRTTGRVSINETCPFLNLGLPASLPPPFPSTPQQ